MEVERREEKRRKKKRFIVPVISVSFLRPWRSLLSSSLSAALGRCVHFGPPKNNNKRKEKPSSSSFMPPPPLLGLNVIPISRLLFSEKKKH
jgi:hypothetical protein